MDGGVGCLDDDGAGRGGGGVGWGEGGVGWRGSVCVGGEVAWGRVCVGGGGIRFYGVWG